MLLRDLKKLEYRENIFTSLLQKILNRIKCSLAIGNDLQRVFIIENVCCNVKLLKVCIEKKKP